MPRLCEIRKVQLCRLLLEVRVTNMGLYQQETPITILEIYLTYWHCSYRSPEDELYEGATSTLLLFDIHAVAGHQGHVVSSHGRG